MMDIKKRTTSKTNLWQSRYNNYNNATEAVATDAHNNKNYDDDDDGAPSVCCDVNASD